MKLIKTEDAVGHVLCHDMTQIIKDQYKDARFRKGHVVTEEDIPVLLSMGKEHLYVWEMTPGMVHENDAAERLLALCGQENMRRSEVKEGKIELNAACDGVFLVDSQRLIAVNSQDEVMIATRKGGMAVRVGDKLAGMRVIGAWVLETFGVKMVMTWWSAIFATVVVIFPLMYRTVRGAFEAFDETLAYSGQTLGLSNTYIFWRIRMPYCRQGVLAGTVLAFARALGEYGATSMIAGYTPGKTATISTTVYQLWQTNNDALAMKWVMVNMAISAVVLLTVNMLERRDFLTDAGRARRGGK